MALAYFMGTVALMTQIFIPCYFANKVIDQSSELSFHLYEANWVDLIASKEYGTRYRKLFVIMSERLKRDTDVVVGIILSLSLSMFATVSVD